MSQQPVERSSNTSPVRLLDRPLPILGLLFFVTLALGLPLLWMSKAFSRTSKMALTIVVLIYTGVLFWLFARVMIWCYQTIMEAVR